jgi:hypothetical protein
LLVFQGELVNDSHEGGDVGTELLKFSVLVVDRCPKFCDGCAEPRFVFGRAAALFDAVGVFERLSDRLAVGGEAVFSLVEIAGVPVVIADPWRWNRNA